MDVGTIQSRLPIQCPRMVRAADEIIDEGHVIGKASREGMTVYRPIV